MDNSKRKKLISMLLTLSLMCTTLTSCGAKKGNEHEPTEVPKEKPTIITIGTHNNQEEDSTYRDPVTGQAVMPPENLAAYTKAKEQVMKDLNVDVKFRLYNGNPQEVILKSVLANDPICDLAIIVYGHETIVQQNVLQPLDKYVDMFKDKECSWMLYDKTYGHNYFVTSDINFLSTWPLVFNITYLQKVDTLKENGKTVLPTDLWKQGKWTWSAFEDYLEKVGAYYSNKKAPIRPEKTIKAYNTGVLYPALGAIKSNGGSIYGKNGIEADSKETKQGVEYIDELVSKKLLTPLPTEWGASEAFNNGETVFVDLQNWLLTAAGDALAKRGEAMGLVPFPRPDNLDKDDKRYQPFVGTLGTMSLLRGLSEEKSDLAMQTFKKYYLTYKREISNSDNALDYFNRDSAKKLALKNGFDVSNSDYGEDMVDAYMGYNPQLKFNDFYKLTQWSGRWDNILKSSILGLNGSPKYDNAIEANKASLIDILKNTEDMISGDKINDNIPPQINLVGKYIAFPKGTDESKIKWSEYLKAQDNIDGEIPIENISIDIANVKFDTCASYNKCLTASVKDKAGNEKKAQFAVVIYDPNNKELPVIEAKKEYRNIKKEENTAKINWVKDFINKAESAEGIDIRNNVTADITQLDITKTGKYNVVLSVVDYAGNKNSVTIEVTVSDK